MEKVAYKSLAAEDPDTSVIVWGIDRMPSSGAELIASPVLI
jgi:hypothetical protein